MSAEAVVELEGGTVLLVVPAFQTTAPQRVFEDARDTKSRRVTRKGGRTETDAQKKTQIGRERGRKEEAALCILPGC